MTTRKHRIYKYLKIWYAECGSCGGHLYGSVWSTACELLRFHVRENHILTEEPVSVHA
jgi:hypothetical protein